MWLDPFDTRNKIFVIHVGLTSMLSHELGGVDIYALHAIRASLDLMIAEQ